MPEGKRQPRRKYMHTAIPHTGGALGSAVPTAAIDPVGDGGGKQYATLVIAANDTTDAGKAAADAVCDGTNDEVEINAALATITPSTWRRVLLLEGTYHIAATINQFGHRAKLEGQGRGTVLRVINSTTTAFYVLDLSGVNHCVVANLTINGNQSNVTVNMRGVNLNTCTGCTLENLLVHDLYYAGVYANDCDRLLIRGCQFIDQDRSTGFGVYIWSSDWVSVQGCVFKDVDGLAGVGIGVSSDCSVVDCQFDNMNNDAVDTHGTGGCTRIVIADNIVNDCASSGIDVGSTGHPLTYSAITGNTITNCTVYGINMSDASHCVIAHNVICDVDDAAINLSASTASYGQLKITGNLIDQCYQGVYGATGDYLSITDNQILYSDRQGIYLIHCENCEVKGNFIIGSGQSADDTYAGITITAGVATTADDNSVQFNTCREGENANHPKYGIEIGHANVNNCLVTNNDIRNSGDTASLQDSGTGTTDRDNDK